MSGRGNAASDPRRQGPGAGARVPGEEGAPCAGGGEAEAARALERRIVARLFVADRRASGDGRAAWTAFLASLRPEEARHPLAGWLAAKRTELDWVENVCDMVSAYFGLPPKPLWPGEQAPGYAEAAAALEQALEDQGLA